MMYSDAVAEEAFKQNKLGFILAGPWNNPAYANAGTNYDVILIPPYEEGGRTGGLQGWDLMYGVTTGDEKVDAAAARWLKYGMLQMDFGKTNVFWMSALGDIAPQVSSGAMSAEDGAEALIEAINDMIADEGE